MSTPLFGIRTLNNNHTDSQVVFNESIYGLDALGQIIAISIESTPPASPSVGDIYLVGKSSTDDWVSEEGTIAYCVNDGAGGADIAWNNITPLDKVTAITKDGSTQLFYDSSSSEWLPIPSSVTSLNGHIEEPIYDDEYDRSFSIMLNSPTKFVITEFHAQIQSGNPPSQGAGASCDIELHKNGAAITSTKIDADDLNDYGLWSITALNEGIGVGDDLSVRVYNMTGQLPTSVDLEDVRFSVHTYEVQDK
jgi:hypothetical protein